MPKMVSSRQILASTTLAATLAVFGCTTNKMPGDGQPTSMPYNSPATTAPTNGTSGGTRPWGGITPMISSGPASMTTRSVDAYAVVAEQQGFRGRILGPSYPGQADDSATMQPTGQFQSPSSYANPEVTVNSSISSEPTPVVINDTGAAGVTFVTGAAVTTTGTSTVTTGAVTSALTTAPTPTAASAAVVTPSQVVTGTPTPTQSSVGIPSPTIAANPVTAGTNRTTMSTATTAAVRATTQRSFAVGSLAMPSAPASAPITIGSAGMTSSSSIGAATMSSPSRSRAVRMSTSNGRRALRVTTTSSGTPMITNQ